MDSSTRRQRWALAVAALLLPRSSGAGTAVWSCTIDSLGLVTYHVGHLALSHEDYMLSVLGRRWGSEYPGFSKEPLDGFRRLLSDLKLHFIAFLAGSDADFQTHVERADALKNAAARLP